jgi:hypothetical protein
MTIEQCIGMSAAELTAMTPEQVTEHFSHYLCITRPEQQSHVRKMEQHVLQANPQFEKARQLAASVGIVIPAIAIMKNKYKK